MKEKIEKLISSIRFDVEEFGRRQYSRGVEDHKFEILTKEKCKEINVQVRELAELIDDKDIEEE